MGKLLRANLSTGVLREEAIPEKALMDFIGGRGLGVKYLYQELSPGIDPLGPENKLIFVTGPLAGTGAQCSSRWLVITKSPLTGTYYRSSGGADFGAWLKFAELDLIIVEGKAEKPVYLYVEDGRCEIRDARELWGKNTAETEERLGEIHGRQVRVACIGPAGERLIRYASIMSGGRGAGRGGVGTVMGSKNLKGIAISTVKRVELPNPKEFKQLVREQIDFMKAQPWFARFSEAGTTRGVDMLYGMGLYPFYNNRQGTLEGFSDRISAVEYAKLKVKNTACYSCGVHCGNVHTVKTGPYAGATNEGPEYETIWAFTGPMANTEIGMTIAADALCDRLGIDTISAGNAVGFAFELFEKGILTLKDTCGLDLTYGNHTAAMALLKMIGERRGLGEILGEGVKRAAMHIGKGAEAYAMHIKGLELPGYEPRAAKVHALNLATSNVGANHCIGLGVQEILNLPSPRPVDRFADQGYSDVTKYNQDYVAMFETGICCVFPVNNRVITPLLFGKMLASATGISQFDDFNYLFRVGERIYNLERCFNLREGFGREDDSFPKRMVTEPLENAGPAEGQIIRKPEVMLDEYYLARGWDERGVPTLEKLKELGLNDIARDIKAGIAQ